MMRLPAALFLVFVTVAAAAQPAKKQDARERPMSQEDRQRMRDDMRDVYRDRNRQDRPQQRPLSPQERERLRRDIQDANKDLRR